MISYVVCMWQKDRFETMALAGLTDQCDRFDTELIVVQHPTSIFHAYETGRKSAKYDIIVYVHEDVVVLDRDLSPKIVNIFSKNRMLGLLGVIGSFESDVVPWWDNTTLLGHMIFQKKSLLPWFKKKKLLYMYANGKGKLVQKANHDLTNSFSTWNTYPKHLKWTNTSPAGFIDGMVMAERRAGIAWDLDTFSGWHCYDYDRAMQVKNAGYDVAISDFLFLHNLQPHNRAWLKEHEKNLHLLRHKWGLHKQSLAGRLWKKLLFQ